MTVSPSIPATVQMRRSRLLALVATVAVVAGGITWAIAASTASMGSSSSSGTASSQTQTQNDAQRTASLSRVKQAAAFGGPGAELSALYGLTPKEAQYVLSITSMTAKQQSAAFGGPGADLSALYGLTPKEAQYVLGITSMTPKQQAAAFGH